MQVISKVANLGLNVVSEGAQDALGLVDDFGTVIVGRGRRAKAVINHKSGKVRRIAKRNPRVVKVVKHAMLAARGNKKQAKKIALTLLRDPKSMLNTMECFHFEGSIPSDQFIPWNGQTPPPYTNVAANQVYWEPLQQGLQVNTPSDLGYQIWCHRDTMDDRYVYISVIQNYGINSVVGPNKIKDNDALFNMWMYYKLNGIKTEITFKCPGVRHEASNSAINNRQVAHTTNQTQEYTTNIAGDYIQGVFLDSYYTWKPQQPGLPNVQALSDSRFLRAMIQSNVLNIKKGKHNLHYKLYERPKWLVNSLTQVQNGVVDNVNDQEIKNNTWFTTAEIESAAGQFPAKSIKYMAYAPISVFRIHLPIYPDDSRINFSFDVTTYHSFAARCAQDWDPVVATWNEVPTQRNNEPGSPMQGPE
jgi:hypothetical protein